MKKKQRCLLRRFAALVAALMLSLSLCVPCFASFADDFNLPSQTEFEKHPRQWYFVRYGDYFYLFANSFFVGSSGVSGNGTYGVATSPISSSFVTSENTTYTIWYGNCSVPSYFVGRYPLPVGYARFSLVAWPSSSAKSAIDSSANGARLFCLDSSDVPIGSQFYSTGAGDATSGPIYRVPIYIKIDSGNNHTWKTLNGPSTFATDSSYYFSSTLSDFYPFTFTAGDWEYNNPYPTSKVISSNNLALTGALVRTSYGEFGTSDFLGFAYSFRIPVSTFRALYGSGYASGSWFPSDEDLQKELLNQFGVDSGTLSDSKSSLDSWSSTPSVNSDVASGASGLLNGIFQNLGTFLFSVSLLCFGAVVLRMLIRKAVEG